MSNLFTPIWLDRLCILSRPKQIKQWLVQSEGMDVNEDAEDLAWSGLGY